MVDLNWIARKRASRMEAIDAMPLEWRELVHDYGLNIVTACRDVGIKKPKQVRHLVKTVLAEMRPDVGSYSTQGVRVGHEPTD